MEVRKREEFAMIDRDCLLPEFLILSLQEEAPWCRLESAPTLSSEGMFVSIIMIPDRQRFGSNNTQFTFSNG
jgi:hypothetical protein